MTVPGSITCPHCGASNISGAAFCESCGKALPSAMPSGPRVVSAEALPQTAAGQALVGDELVKQTKKAFTAMLVVAIIQFAMGGLLFLVTRNAPRAQVDQTQMTVILAIVFGIGIVFLALAFWARRMPLPAAIVGLVLYLTVWLLDVIADPTQIARGIIIKIIVIAMLVQAIQAGLKHKRLLRATGAGAGAAAM